MPEKDVNYFVCILTWSTWISFFMFAWCPGALKTSFFVGASLFSFRMSIRRGAGMSLYRRHTWLKGTPNFTLFKRMVRIQVTTTTTRIDTHFSIRWIPVQSEATAILETMEVMVLFLALSSAGLRRDLIESCRQTTDSSLFSNIRGNKGSPRLEGRSNDWISKPVWMIVVVDTSLDEECVKSNVLDTSSEVWRSSCWSRWCRLRVFSCWWCCDTTWCATTMMLGDQGNCSLLSREHCYTLSVRQYSFYLQQQKNILIQARKEVETLQQ